jgi:hypothetical protein
MRNIADQILARIFDHSMIAFTAFVSLCTNPVQPLAIGHTMHAIGEMTRSCGPPSDTSLVIKFADSWRRLVQDLIQHPDDAQLGYAAEGLLLACPRLLFQSQPSAIPLFMDVLSLYQGALQTQIPQNRSGLRTLELFRKITSIAG